MTYEDYGYMCADSMLSTLVEQPCQSAPQPVFNDKEGSIWKQPLTAITAGIHLDSEGVARQHAILCLAFRQFCHIGLVSDDDGRRILQGMMNRFDERFSDFSSDPLTADAAADYLRAAATDIKNKSKTESFPTLVPLAIERITGLKPSDPRWAAVSDSLYSLLEGNPQDGGTNVNRNEEKRKACMNDKSPNQSMKPTAPFRNESSMFVTIPCRGLSLSR